MALDVWYKSDIQNALSAAEQASRAALKASGAQNDPYVIGYRAALATLALAFGLVPAQSRAAHLPALAADRSPPWSGDRRCLVAWEMEMDPVWEEV